MTQVQKLAKDFSTDAVINGDFTKVTLSDYRGKWVVLFFYPLSFTGICESEVVAFARKASDFKKIGAELIGVSVDSKYAHQAWIRELKEKKGLAEVTYPIASDLKKTISADYGVLSDGGMALRAWFLINPDGKVVAEMVNDLPIGRNVEEVLREVKAFQHLTKTGEACKVNWQPAD